MNNKINGRLIKFLDRDCIDLQHDPLFSKLFANYSMERIYEDYFLSNEINGVELTFRDEVVVKAIRLTQVYETSEYCELNTLLIKPVNFSLSRQDTIDLLGQPLKQGGGQKDAFFKDGIIPYWAKYVYSNGTCHFQYTSDKKSIELITLGSLTLETT